MLKWSVLVFWKKTVTGKAEDFTSGRGCGLIVCCSYLALGGSHLSKQSLGHFGPLHLLLDLVVDGGVDVEDAALRLAVPLAGQR